MPDSLTPRTVIVNKYSGARLVVVRYNEHNCEYECARLPGENYDGQSQKVYVGRNWQFTYEVERRVKV